MPKISLPIRIRLKRFLLPASEQRYFHKYQLPQQLPVATAATTMMKVPVFIEMEMETSGAAIVAVLDETMGLVE